ncbi:SGNH/GDSL hydrolase family protein [Actinomadura kijaniata]|uniref:SGNH/GDSL hydrolase family protein n=1 Tax=Actinomadura kijaniata TaxID=46161 RepID=UPI003F1DD674
MKKVLGLGAASLTLAASAVVGNAAAAGGAASAGGTAALREGERYVALGDSFTAGPLIPKQHGTPAGCMRSDHNYPSLVAERVRAKLTDVSCSGAKTSDMTAAQRTPLGVNPPQLNAVTADTSLVTVGIGGNDIGFGEISIGCGLASATNPLGAPCTARYGATIDQRIRETAPKIAAVLNGIRTRAPQARVLVVGYLRLVPERPGCWPVVPIAQGDLAFLDGAERRLNAMLAEQAKAGGATFVDAYKDGLGHDMCAAADRKWVEGIVLTSLAAPIHPNAAGMREVADRVVRALNASRDV